MRRLRGRLRFHLIILSAMLAVGAPSAEAEPITVEGYTITDLGPVYPQVASAGIWTGSGTVTASNGQTYAFPQTPTPLPNPGQGILAAFPLFAPAPVNDPNTFGNPGNAFSNATVLALNSGGIAVAVDSYGVSGHQYNNEVYYVQHNADGSWGQPVGVWAGTTQFQGIGTGWGFQVAGLSNANEVLINNFSSASQANTALLFNINTHTLTDLFGLLNSAKVPFNNFVPLEIDDDGRILLGAQPTASNFDPIHTLLLTPEGVSSEPLESAVPEPDTLAVVVMAIAGFAAHRLRERRLNCTLTRGLLARRHH